MNQSLSDDQVVALATAAVSAFPAASPLVAGAPQAVEAGVVDAFAAAVAADLVHPGEGCLVVLVGPELTAALQQSPVGELDVAAAVRPALDAMSATLGVAVGPARGIEPGAVLAELGGPARAVLLAGTAVEAALVVPDATRVPATGPGGPSEDAGRDGPHAPSLRSVGGRGIEMLHGVEMDVTVELGRTRMTVRDLLDLAPGAVLELDRAAGSPADLLVNGRLVARGEVVVVDEDFGLRITEVLDGDAGLQGRAV